MENKFELTGNVKNLGDPWEKLNPKNIEVEVGVKVTLNVPAPTQLKFEWPDPTEKLP